jgi:hypothetical protein
MKTKLFLSLALTLLTGFSVVAPSLRTSNLSPGAPNVSPVSPGFNNVFGPMFNSQFGTNVVPPNFGNGLTSLQNDIQQLLPLLANFNDSVDFSALSSAVQSTANNATGSTAPVPVSGQNLSTRTSTDFSTLLSRDVSSRPAGTAPNGSISTAINAPSQTAIVPSPTGVNNAFGLAPGFGGPITTNAFGTAVTARDVVRDLIVLQNDLERLLPVLVTLNGSSLPPGFTNMVGSVNQSSSSAINTALTAGRR